MTRYVRISFNGKNIFNVVAMQSETDEEVLARAREAVTFSIEESTRQPPCQATHHSRFPANGPGEARCLRREGHYGPHRDAYYQEW